MSVAIHRPGIRTMTQLVGVHPDLVGATLIAFRVAPTDFCILEGGGLRSHEEARANAARGTGIVNSLHIKQGDGYGWAVDLVPFVNGAPTWEKKHFPDVHAAMWFACTLLEVPVQNGADWDNDGILGERGEFDWPHWQFARREDRKAQAIMRLERHLAILERAQTNHFGLADQFWAFRRLAGL